LSLSILLAADGKFVQTPLGSFFLSASGTLPAGPYSLVIRSTTDSTRIREGRFETGLGFTLKAY